MINSHFRVLVSFTASPLCTVKILYNLSQRLPCHSQLSQLCHNPISQQSERLRSFCHMSQRLPKVILVLRQPPKASLEADGAVQLRVNLAGFLKFLLVIAPLQYDGQEPRFFEEGQILKPHQEEVASKPGHRHSSSHGELFNLRKDFAFHNDRQRLWIFDDSSFCHLGSPFVTLRLDGAKQTNSENTERPRSTCTHRRSRDTTSQNLQPIPHAPKTLESSEDSPSSPRPFLCSPSNTYNEIQG